MSVTDTLGENLLDNTLKHCGFAMIRYNQDYSYYIMQLTCTDGSKMYWGKSGPVGLHDKPSILVIYYDIRSKTCSCVAYK